MKRTIYLGETDIASFICRSGDNVKIINTGEDGSIYAIITNDPSNITEDHQLKFECKTWLDIYDDEGITFSSTRYSNRFKRIRLFYLPEMVWEEDKQAYRMVTPPGFDIRFLIVLE